MNMYENVWKCMKMYENVWKCMKIYENLWDSMFKSVFFGENDDEPLGLGAFPIYFAWRMSMFSPMMEYKTYFSNHKHTVIF